MTTVIATHTAVYGDSFCGGAHAFTTRKIGRFRHGGKAYLYGGCGDLDEVNFIVALMEQHGPFGVWRLSRGDNWPPEVLKDADSDIVIVTEDRKMYLMDEDMVAAEVLDKTMCIGSGGKWAAAAMDFGKTPLEALEYAASKDHNSRGPFHKITFRSK